MAVMRGEKLLTASDLAALCEVDLKTIHNWVDRGRIAHFRTPGRHLRFRAADVADFLRAWGYSVPRELSRASSRSALVVGTRDTLSHVMRALGEQAAPGARAASQGGQAVSTVPGEARPGEPARPSPSQPGEGPLPAGAASPPVRHAKHPYDALIFAGADPADVY